MRDVLEALATGEIDVAEAEAELAGYATVGAGRFDAARERRRGIPEAVFAEGKTPKEVAELVSTAVTTTGRGIASRVDSADVDAIELRIADEHQDASVIHHDRARMVVVRGADADRPEIDATVAVVTGGTADAVPAGEAAVIASEIGADVERLSDVGVANVDRLLDRIETIRAADVAIVAAGREGSLPTVVAGLVDTPVIALPVDSGYGYGGDGEAALLGALQSCTVLTTVNVDAGFVAGAQAGLIARAIVN